MSEEQGAAVAGAFWSLAPVVVITSSLGDKINGQVAVTSVTSSIVHEVPRLLVGIWKANYTHSFIMESKSFTIHLLRQDQFSLVKNFGFYTGRERDKFKDIKHTLGVTGSPVIEDVHSFAECRVLNAMDGGDMTAFLVSVVNGGINTGGSWMTLSDFYRDAPPGWVEEYSVKLAQSVKISMDTINDIDYAPWKP